MCKRFCFLAAVVLSLIAAPALAQCGCGGGQVAYYAPPAPAYTTYYAPAATYYAPASYVSYYAPAPAYTTYYAPAPYATYYAPATPYATYYAPPVPYATYYAAPAYVAYPRVAVGPSIYGTPKVYVRGEPVRNALRAVTP
jgi:hypothetical protein